MVGRTGGLLLIAGSAVAAFWAIALSGPAGPNGTRDDGLLVAAFTLLLGTGAGAVAIAAPLALDLKLTRVGLGLVSIGLLSVGLGRTVVVIPAGSNELSSLPYLFLVFGGGLVSMAGWLACGVSLLRSPGWSRVVGLVMLGSAVGLFIPAPGPAFLAVGSAGIGLLSLGLRPTRSLHA
jgi:hypothetical protein